MLVSFGPSNEGNQKTKDFSLEITLGKARGLIQYVIHPFYISYLKKEFLKSVENEASGHKNAFKDFYG